jgi:hypothetical protein
MSQSDDAVHTPETLVYFNETTRRSIPEGCHLPAEFTLIYPDALYYSGYVGS